MFNLLKHIQFNQLIVVKPKISLTVSSKCFSTRQISTTKLYRNKLLHHNLKNVQISPNIRNYSVLSRRNDEIVLQYCRNLFFPQHFTYKLHAGRVEKNGEPDLEQIKSQYPLPVGTMHNFYSVVAQELKEPKCRITPIYKSVNSPKKERNQLQWTCTYSLKWPEEIKFQSTAFSKHEAACKAAWAALLHLEKSGKIINGAPKFYDKDAMRQITRESNYTLNLENKQIKQLESINNIFESQLLPLLNNEQLDNKYTFESNIAEPTSQVDVLDNWLSEDKISSNQLDIYRAKETVNLPVQNHRREFEDLLNSNQIVIIRGETGCGKSTRIPQYVLEHFTNATQQSNARIVVTQPRRIAAISLAERVAHERNEQVGRVVGFQVRLNSAFNPKTGRILYCTTGILLRQIQTDPNLSNCTHVILDEAHERDVNTDLLMNLLRQALKNNPNLKLIIMSATIDINLFKNYFNDPPVMHIPGFAYPVKSHYLEDMKKIDLSRTCDNWYKNNPAVIYEDIAKVIRWIHRNKPEGAILVFLPGWEEITKIKNNLLGIFRQNECSVVTIHSKLSYDDQKRIFRRVPPGVRKIILATNIAETSVTVDDVVYVVDAGIHKETKFDTDKGIMCIDNSQISQSSMQQRRGRAGRVCPGECYHIYPRECSEQMSKYSLPEILRMSLTKIVLDAKVYSHNMNAEEFFSHLPCPPKNSAVKNAVEELQELEMLDEHENLTLLGRVVSNFQLPPKLSKAMIHSVIYKCVIPIVDIATLFSFDSNMFSTTLTDKEFIKETKAEHCNNSDHIAQMILFEQWANLMSSEEFTEASMYCSRYNLIPQKLNTLQKLKNVHYEYLEKYLSNALELSDDLSANQELIKGVLLSGVGSILLQRNWTFVKGRLKKQKVLLTKDNHKATITSESVNSKKSQTDSPFLVYINETRSEMRRMSIIRETSIIQPLTVILFINNDLTFLEVSSFNKTDNIEDPVLIRIEGTKFQILCSRTQAQMIWKCKNSFKQMENYFIYQLTKGGEENDKIIQKWNEVLLLVNELLSYK